jgi:hypothetical protein
MKSATKPRSPTGIVLDRGRARGAADGDGADGVGGHVDLQDALDDVPARGC